MPTMRTHTMFFVAVALLPAAIGCVSAETRGGGPTGGGGVTAAAAGANGGTAGTTAGSAAPGAAGNTPTVGSGAGGSVGGAGGAGGASASGAAGDTIGAAGSAAPDAGAPEVGGAPDARPGAGGPPTIQMFESNCLSTPDPDIAAGPTLVATAIQWNAYFFKKDTGVLDHKYTWKALRGSLISDTHVVFDRASKKWFMTTIVNLGNSATGVQFMVSTDETATSWNLSVPIEMQRLIDDPQPTVTSDKVVITESGKCIWAVDKAALIAGNAPTVQAINCTLAQNNQVAAIKFGGTPPSTAYAITMSDSTHVNWISTEGTPAGGDLKVTEHKVAVPAVTEIPLAGITQNNVTGLESGQVKAMWQNNHIVWSKTIKCATGSCIRAFDVDVVAGTVKSDDFAIAGTQLFYGASGFDSIGNMWLLSSSVKPAGFVGLSLAGRSAAGVLSQPKEIVAGLAAIAGTGLIRFGDYVGAAQDPVDGSTWILGQYAGQAKGALNPENNAACKVVHVTPN